MNKRDVEEMIYNEFKAHDNKVEKGEYKTALEISQGNRAVYGKCKTEAAKFGYTSACYDQIYNRVVDRRAREMNIRPNY